VINVGLKSLFFRLSKCSITEEGYKALASALNPDPSAQKELHPSHLIELDLRGNDPGKSGVKHLLDAQQKPECKLKIR